MQTNQKQQSPVINIKGDLLKQQHLDIIVQQTNCISKSGAGLAEQIAKELKVDMYKWRQQPDVPGSMKVAKSQLSHGKSNPRFVANIFSQYAPGKGSHKPYYLNNQKIDDNQFNRACWFSQGLEELGQHILEYNDNFEDEQIKAVGFPYNIGCGLAGGDWSVFSAAIDNFAIKYQNNFLCYIVTYQAQNNGGSGNVFGQNYPGKKEWKQNNNITQNKQQQSQQKSNFNFFKQGAKNQFSQSRNNRQVIQQSQYQVLEQDQSLSNISHQSQSQQMQQFKESNLQQQNYDSNNYSNSNSLNTNDKQKNSNNYQNEDQNSLQQQYISQNNQQNQNYYQQQEENSGTFANGPQNNFNNNSLQNQNNYSSQLENQQQQPNYNNSFKNLGQNNKNKERNQSKKSGGGVNNNNKNNNSRNKKGNDPNQMKISQFFKPVNK